MSATMLTLILTIQLNCHLLARQLSSTGLITKLAQNKYNTDNTHTNNTKIENKN